MSNNILKNEITLEMAFLQSIASKIFLCPFIGRTKFQMIGYYSICVLILCTIMQLFLTLFIEGSKVWIEIINVAPNLGVIVMAYIKYTKIHAYKEFYEETFYHFQDDFWNIVATKSKEHQKIIKTYKWMVMVINRFLVYYTMPLAITVDSFPYLLMVYKNKVHGVSDEYLYPYDAWYPFDKVQWYAAAYLWESFMTATVIAVFTIADVIHVSYVGFICMELKILGNCLEEILSPHDVEEMRKGHNVSEIHRTVVRKLKVIIVKHNFLAKTSSKLDKVLGDAMLLNYSLGAIFICLTAFTFTVIDVTYKRIRYFLMFMSLVIEIFNNCLLGQVLSDHSKSLTEAIYFSDWPNASPETKKLMLMFMVRAQKPFQLTGNGYIVMNMNSYSSICSTSYQLYNLLRTIYQ
nr:putative odorant receptor 92a [Maniola hyperantus]